MAIKAVNPAEARCIPFPAIVRIAASLAPSKDLTSLDGRGLIIMIRFYLCFTPELCSLKFLHNFAARFQKKTCSPTKINNKLRSAVGLQCEVDKDSPEWITIPLQSPYADVYTTSSDHR